MRILIADDDRTSTLTLGRTLIRWGFEVIVVHDGVAACEHLLGQAAAPLAIVDWMMPGLDGLELCRRIRATPPRAPVYLMLLTARSSRQDVVAGLQAGADDYLTKPFDPDELRARLHVGQRTLTLMASIKRLSGLLPICSYCKCIRSDQNYWERVESYVAERSDAQFSHGICPPCFETAMQDVNSRAPTSSPDTA